MHGLLTATLPTKIGGDINFIAREMIFKFHRPVFSGDTVRCEVTILELTEDGRVHTAKVLLGVSQSARQRSDERAGAGDR